MNNEPYVVMRKINFIRAECRSDIGEPYVFYIQLNSITASRYVVTIDRRKFFEPHLNCTFFDGDRQIGKVLRAHVWEYGRCAYLWSVISGAGLTYRAQTDGSLELSPKGWERLSLPLSEHKAHHCAYADMAHWVVGTVRNPPLPGTLYITQTGNQNIWRKIHFANILLLLFYLFLFFLSTRILARVFNQRDRRCWTTIASGGSPN